MNYSIKQLADISGVTVRTLHYYDEIGLLKPSFIHENGYRYYTTVELKRLQQILFFRELEFPLEKIKNLMESAQFDSVQALKDQKKLLEIKKHRVEKLLTTIDITLKGGEQPMNAQSLFDPFKDEDYLKYKDEVEKKWGNTDSYKESMERMKKWSKQDLEMIKKEGIDITLSIADVMDKKYSDPEVQHEIKRHFEHMQKFYTCSKAFYKNLGTMYVEDPRFTAYYEKVKPRLALFMRDAMHYFADTI